MNWFTHLGASDAVAIRHTNKILNRVTLWGLHPPVVAEGHLHRETLISINIITNKPKALLQLYLH